ncbi:MAG: response regulator [Nitrospirota bacterium]
MTRPRIVLADDHLLVTDGMSSMLRSDFDVVATVENGRELVEAVRRLDPDVVITDMQMPVLNGIDAVAQLTKLKARAKVIVLTMHPDVSYAVRALRAGAAGFVLKHAAYAELATAIREVLKGRTYLTPMIAKDVLAKLMQTPDDPAGLSQLTARQREIMQLSAEGRSAKEIASTLNVSPRTVEFHKASIMDRLRLRTHSDLVREAVKHGLIAP